MQGITEDLRNDAGKTITTEGESSATENTASRLSSAGERGGLPDGDADPKGKRFLGYSNSWLSSAGSLAMSDSHLTGDKGVFRCSGQGVKY